jgi:hypothetical protein
MAYQLSSTPVIILISYWIKSALSWNNADLYSADLCSTENWPSMTITELTRADHQPELGIDFRTGHYFPQAAQWPTHQEERLWQNEQRKWISIAPSSQGYINRQGMATGEWEVWVNYLNLN